MNYKKYSNRKIKYYVNVFYNFFLFYFLIFISIVLLRYTVNKKQFFYTINGYFVASVRPFYFLIKQPFNLFYSTTLSIKRIIFYKSTIDSLMEENKELEFYKNRLKILEAENNELKSDLQLNFSEQTERYLWAKIYYDFSNLMEKKIVIRVGSLAGIRQNNLVLDKDNNLLGRVIEVEDNKSIILLITSIFSNIPAKTVNTNEKLILSGNGNDKYLKIRYFQSNQLAIEENESVVTLGDIIPENFVIGKIVKHKNSYLIETKSEIHKLNFVKVLIN